MLPLETFSRRPDGVPSRLPDPQLIISPAAGMTQSEWLHMLVVSLLMRGNGFGRKGALGANALPAQVELLNPDHVRVDVDKVTGAVTYKLHGVDQVLTEHDIWHVRGLTLPGQKVGLSPVSYAAATLGIDTSSRQFAQQFFTDGAHPSSILSTSELVTQDQARTIKDRFLEAVTGREPAVLGAGVTYTPIQVTPEESQFLATQQANVAQIARFFWIPPEMVGGSGGNSMTYANVEQRSLDFLTYAVSFWLKRIEDAMFDLLPARQYVRFNTAALLRTDAETQAKVDNMHLAGKILAPSEIRSREGLPPMTDAQRTEADMVPLTVTPMGGAKALPALKNPPGAPAPVPAVEGATNAPV